MFVSRHEDRLLDIGANSSKSDFSCKNTVPATLRFLGTHKASRFKWDNMDLLIYCARSFMALQPQTHDNRYSSHRRIGFLSNLYKDISASTQLKIVPAKSISRENSNTDCQVTCHMITSPQNIE